MFSLVTPMLAKGVSALDIRSGRVLLALLPLFVVAGALIAYCLVDLIRAPSVRYLPKPVWALVILLVSVPIGTAAYLLLGRDRTGTANGTAADDSERPVDDHLTI